MRCDVYQSCAKSFRCCPTHDVCSAYIYNHALMQARMHACLPACVAARMHIYTDVCRHVCPCILTTHREPALARCTAAEIPINGRLHPLKYPLLYLARPRPTGLPAHPRTHPPVHVFTQRTTRKRPRLSSLTPLMRMCARTHARRCMRTHAHAHMHTHTDTQTHT